MAYFGLPEYGPAESCVADPRFVLPELIHLCKGSKLEIFKDNTLRRVGGVCDPTIGQIVGSPPGPLRVYDFLDDRWVIAAKSSTTTGDYTFRITQGAAFAETTIRVIDALDPGAATFYCSQLGDSGVGNNTATRFGGLVQAAMPSHVSVGTKGSNPLKNEGLNSNIELTISDPGSPFTDGSGNFNASTFGDWVAALDNPPDVIVNSLIANSLNSFADDDPATWPALIESILDAYDDFYAVALDVLPDCLFLHCTGWPGNMANQPWEDTYGLEREGWRELYHLYLEAALVRFQGREAENIYLCATHLEINPQGVSNYGDYPNSEAHHFNEPTGHVRVARRMVNDLVGYLGLSA